MSVTLAVRRHFSYVLLFFILSSLGMLRCLATIAIPTDLRSMVRKADLVFTGKVTGQRAEWANRNGQRSIVTFVSLDVLEVHKGAAGKNVNLRCPGGTIGETTLELVGMPSFTKDERCVLFVRTNANAVCPIVGIYHGKLLIEKASDGTERLAHHDGRAVNDIADIGKDNGGIAQAAGAQGPARPLTLSELKAHIQEELANSPAEVAR